MELPLSYLRPHLSVPRGCSTELTHVGTQFLVRAFDAHDKDRDGFLNPAELEQLFFVITKVECCGAKPFEMSWERLILPSLGKK